jgi:hypothetical protein
MYAMQLTEEQKQKVTAWVSEGMKLSDIQSKLASDFELRATYMDVRLLVDDLKLTPKDPEPPKQETPAAAPAPAAAEPAAATLPADAEAELLPPGGKVALTVDTIARPGTMVSGAVTFSDGKKAAWYLDQTGRLGVFPETQGYRPPEGDVEVFQTLLDRELQKLGY